MKRTSFTRPFAWALSVLFVALHVPAFAQRQASAPLFPLLFEFPDRDLQHWQSLNSRGNSNTNDVQLRAVDNGSRDYLTPTVPHGSGVLMANPRGNHAHDSAHPAAILRSPEFTVDPRHSASAPGPGMCTATSVKIRLQGGTGTTSPGPGRVLDLPFPNSAPTDTSKGFQGVALRRVSDDTYLLWGRKNSNGDHFEIIEWNAGMIANATAHDAADERYTVDIIEAGHQSWGWITVDYVEILSTTPPTLEPSSGPAPNEFPLVFDFPRNDLQLWESLDSRGQPNEEDFRFRPDNANRPTTQQYYMDPPDEPSGVALTSAGAEWAHDGPHPAAILRSPAFTIDPNGTQAAPGPGMFSAKSIVTRLQGGTGTTASAPQNVSDLPYPTTADTSTPKGFQGVALRRVSDDAYLLWGRKSANGDEMEPIVWDSSTLAAASGNDPAGTLYTIDVVDAGNGGWGWIALDFVKIISSTQPSFPKVALQVTDAQGSTHGADKTMSVRFSRTGDLGQPLTIRYDVAGDAAEFFDFAELPDYNGDGYEIEIPTNQDHVDLPIHLLGSAPYDFDRSLVLKLLPGAYLRAGKTSATLWIRDFEADPGHEIALSQSPPGQDFYPFPNPFQGGTAGSLFLYGEVWNINQWVALGLYPQANDNTIRGAIDIGRNSTSGQLSLFNYLTHAGEDSAQAQIAASPSYPLSETGRYTIIAELRLDENLAGTIRVWAWDGTTGSLDYQAPLISTAVPYSFRGLGDTLYFRAQRAQSEPFGNVICAWVPGTDHAALTAAFQSLVPARPWVFVDAIRAAATSSPSDPGLTFRFFRSGPPGEKLTLHPFQTGDFDDSDFIPPFPASLSIPAGRSYTDLQLKIPPLPQCGIRPVCPRVDGNRCHPRGGRQSHRHRRDLSGPSGNLPSLG